MHDNIDKVVQRGEKLDDLGEREQVTNNSHTYMYIIVVAVHRQGSMSPVRANVLAVHGCDL